MAEIKLQLLLKRPIEAAEFDQIERLLADIGISISGRGRMTVSARISANRFESVFSTKPGEASSNLIGKTLPVPNQLERYIASISEAPKHERMD